MGAEWEAASYVIKKIIRGIEVKNISGIPPKTPASFTAGYNGVDKVQCRMTFNKFTYIGDELVCVADGAVIIRKEGSNPPISIEDGVQIADVKIPNEGFSAVITDSTIQTGKTYTYRPFVYSDHNVYNLYSPVYNTVKITDIEDAIFGFTELINVPSNTKPEYIPSKTGIAYDLLDTINYGWDFARARWSNDDTYGNWKPFVRKILKNYPAMINTNDGKIQTQLSSDRYNFETSGGATYEKVLDLSNRGFAWVNKIYYKSEVKTRTVYTTTSPNNPSTMSVRETRFSKKPFSGATPYGFQVYRNGEIQEVEGVWLPILYKHGSWNLSADQYAGYLNLDAGNGINVTDYIKYLGGEIVQVLKDIYLMMFGDPVVLGHTDSYTIGNYSLRLLQCPSILTTLPEFGYNQWRNHASSNSTTYLRYGTSKMFHSHVLGGFKQWLWDPYVTAYPTAYNTISGAGYTPGKIIYHRYYDTEGTNDVTLSNTAAMPNLGLLSFPNSSTTEGVPSLTEANVVGYGTVVSNNKDIVLPSYGGLSGVSGYIGKGFGRVDPNGLYMTSGRNYQFETFRFGARKKPYGDSSLETDTITASIGNGLWLPSDGDQYGWTHDYNNWMRGKERLIIPEAQYAPTFTE